MNTKIKIKKEKTKKAKKERNFLSLSEFYNINLKKLENANSLQLKNYGVISVFENDKSIEWNLKNTQFFLETIVNQSKIKRNFRIYVNIGFWNGNREISFTVTETNKKFIPFNLVFIIKNERKVYPINSLIDFVIAIGIIYRQESVIYNNKFLSDLKIENSNYTYKESKEMKINYDNKEENGTYVFDYSLRGNRKDIFIEPKFLTKFVLE